ncbi:hypothetical protein BBP40_007845 [Aspergillus hancockii]|nr:hypothetical protein BBP40_007845 [Aspergillus hancockii]
MDAVEDKEIKLQRASSDLVKEFSVKLPSLLWKPRTEKGDTRVPRRWTQAAKAERLVGVLEPFQEWPQLLDPHLQTLLPPLVDAFLAYLLKHRDQYKAGKPQQQRAIYPLPRAVFRLLYTFCKVRGVKVISRFLNNEPKYLDPLLRAFIEWDTACQDDSEVVSPGDVPRRLVWEERYVMLIWLSHLLLAPFDLASISSDDIPVPYETLGQIKPLPAEVPTVAKSLLSLSLNYVNASGKEREAATVLLARLVLRRDMQALGLLTNLTDWAFSIVRSTGNIEPPSVYTCIGVLSFLARLGASGQVEDFASLIVPVFEKTIHTTQGDSGVSHIIQSSALAQKTIIKIIRSMTIMALTLSERSDSPLSDDKVSFILEDAIDHFLVALADKDTPVRFAASKALSIITFKLDPDMGTEVIEAVTSSLEENILYENSDGAIVTPLEARRIGLHSMKRNLSAVDAQRWQGLILTLGHLLFRRAPPINQLLNIIQPLISGLDFEQRSSTGSSVGTGVRDAACFGIWALSRKYATQELLALQAQTIRIPLVQVVDYHAVARRSRAMIDVAKATATLSYQYWGPLVESFMHWRGVGSPDAESRRQAAKALGGLSSQRSYKTMAIVLQRLLNKLSSLPRGDVETRHGCFLALSATVDAFNTQQETSVGDRDPSEALKISVLGAIFKKIRPEDDSRQSIIRELLQCAGKDELIEKRVVAVKSLATGVLPHIDVTDTIADHLIEFLNDYTTDRRGDIGSLVRLEAIQAAKIILQKASTLVSRTAQVQSIIGCLCRLAAEKLDKVRLQAWLCLQSFWESAEDFPPLQSHVSLPDYFLQLLELQAIDWLRLPLFQGLATSAVAGAEGLVRSTRSALVQSFNGYEVEQRQGVVTAIIKDLMVALSDKLQDDRYAIPLLDFLAFLLDGYIDSIPQSSEPSFRKLFVLVQKAHFKSSNVMRLEAATRVYAPLSRLEPLRTDVLKKMTAMLLHPFPRVRNGVAEYLFMETSLDAVKAEDWTKPPKEVKGQVESVRNVLACK